MVSTVSHSTISTSLILAVNRYGDRAFCVSGPTEWNKLSLEIRQAKSVDLFKTELKTLLFKEYYGL